MFDHVKPMRAPKNSSATALVGIWTILLVVFVVGILYVGREVLIPLALAALITFLLAPVVTRLERFIGRIAAVLIVVVMLFGVLTAAGWMLTRQLIDLAEKLPDYQTNIESKLHSIRLPTGGPFNRLTNSIAHLRRELPGAAPSPAPRTPQATEKPSATPVQTVEQSSATPVPVRVVDSRSETRQWLQTIAAAVLSPLGTAGLVLLLVVFMLLKREDLRGRVIRLIGQGHISETTRAMDDAGHRVARYLSMQFLVNTGYGILIGVGLYFIGVPNAILWGAFAAVMRFIPYIGPWIGAVIPVLLSFAVSKSWLTPIYTLSLFGVLELINANLLEPWLYGSSTGVSSIALIVAAVFWTWLWGPVGLLLSTPLTVCLTVMGRHVPRLHFLTVLLSEEEALSPAEECYHRLLALGSTQTSDLAERFLKENSLTALYDTMLLPVVTAVEIDVQRRALEPNERATLYENLTDIIEDIGARLAPNPEADKSVTEAAPPPPNAPACRVFCVPSRAQRDEIAALMLAQLLRQQNFEVETAPATLSHSELVERVVQSDWDAICSSVVPPSTLTHARYLTGKLRARSPDMKIAVGFWGATENMGDAAQRLRMSGADEVVVSFAEAVLQLLKFSVEISDEMMAPAIPENEGARLEQLAALQILDTPNERRFDRVTARLARVFQVPIALITFIDRERQWFKSQFGLPDEMAQAGSTPRALSICGHMVADDEMLVVEDIARDRRFANNPLLKGRGLRFYAGVPLRVNDLAVGSLCLLDVRPRRFSEENRRLLQLMADEVIDELNDRVTTHAAKPGSANNGAT